MKPKDILLEWWSEREVNYLYDHFETLQEAVTFAKDHKMKEYKIYRMALHNY